MAASNSSTGSMRGTAMAGWYSAGSGSGPGMAVNPGSNAGHARGAGVGGRWERRLKSVRVQLSVLNNCPYLSPAGRSRWCLP